MIKPIAFTCMVFVYFSGVDLAGNYRECSFGGPDAETAFDAISRLVNHGWQLYSITLKEKQNDTHLPIDAFEGELMGKPIKNLMHTWQEILT